MVQDKKEIRPILFREVVLKLKQGTLMKVQPNYWSKCPIFALSLKKKKKFPERSGEVCSKSLIHWMWGGRQEKPPEKGEIRQEKQRQETPLYSANVKVRFVITPSLSRLDLFQWSDKLFNVLIFLHFCGSSAFLLSLLIFPLSHPPALPTAIKFFKEILVD